MTRRRCSALCTPQTMTIEWTESRSAPASPSSRSATTRRARSGGQSMRCGRRSRRAQARSSSRFPAGERRDNARPLRPVWEVQCERGTSFEVASPVQVSTRRVVPNELAHHVAMTIVIIAAAVAAAAVLVGVVMSRRRPAGAPPNEELVRAVDEMRSKMDELAGELSGALERAEHGEPEKPPVR